MKREWRIYPVEKFFQLYPHLRRDDIIIGIDEKNAEDIIKRIEERISTFRRILKCIFSGHRNNDLYRREDISKKAKDVYAMKFKSEGI